MRLYIIRHGESTNNRLDDQLPYEEYVRERTADPSLTALGHRQAKAVAQHLLSATVAEHHRGQKTGAGYGITRLYCSAMLRALQTAQPIQEALAISPEVMIEIHEQGGLFEGNPRDIASCVGHPGLTRSEMSKLFPGYIIPDAVTENGWWPHTHESRADCIARAQSTARQLTDMARRYAEEEREEDVALVAHGDFIDRLVKALLDQLPGDHFYYVHYNTAITQIDFAPNGRRYLRYTNRTEHLSPAIFED